MADFCAGGDGFLDEDLALGKIVGHACCGAELADCLEERVLLLWQLDLGEWSWLTARTMMAKSNADAAVVRL